MPALEALQQTEWSVQFERYMRNRLVMGAFRYGLLQAPDKHDYNRVDSAIERLMEYKRTHNLELLVDSANIALLEFVEGTHPDRHWSSVDDGPHVSHC
jgi:myosin-crossreactive antigen